MRSVHAGWFTAHEPAMAPLPRRVLRDAAGRPPRCHDPDPDVSLHIQLSRRRAWMRPLALPDVAPLATRVHRDHTLTVAPSVAARMLTGREQTHRQAGDAGPSMPPMLGGPAAADARDRAADQQTARR